MASAAADRSGIAGIWHSPSNFQGTFITAILTFQPDGSFTGRDAIDYGSGDSGEYYGGNQGIWHRSPNQYFGNAIEHVYNRTTGEPTHLSIAKATIVLDEDGQTFTGMLSIVRSHCVIDDCPVPDMSLVDTNPMFEISFSGSKILSYDDKDQVATTANLVSSSTSSGGSIGKLAKGPMFWSALGLVGTMTLLTLF